MRMNARLKTEGAQRMEATDRQKANCRGIRQTQFRSGRNPGRLVRIEVCELTQNTRRNDAVSSAELAGIGTSPTYFAAATESVTVTTELSLNVEPATFLARTA